MRKLSFLTNPEKSLVIYFSLMLIAYIATFAYFRHQSLLNVPLNLVTLSVLVPIFLIDGLKTMLEAISKKTFHPLREDLTKVSVIIPTHNGAATIGATLENLLRRFDRERIFVSSNGSTDETCAIASTYGVNVIDIENLLGKVEAINQALSSIVTPYVLILDDDTLVNGAVIPTNLLDEGYAAVAFRVLPVRSNFWSILQLHEYRKSMDIGRVFHNGTGTVQTVSGAIGLFNTRELIRQMFSHSGEFSGEDLQRTLLVHLAERKRGVVMADSTVRTVVPATFTQLFWQRVLGWYPGQIATLRIYRRLLFHKNIPLRLRFEAFYTLLMVTAIEPFRVLSLPVMLFSPVFFGIAYLFYFISELFLYLALGKKEPFWVVLIAPLYGLINSLCRAIAFVVFIYRRTAYHLGNGEKFDDYKQTHYLTRMVSATLTLVLVGGLLTLYCLLFIVPASVKSEIATVVIPHDTSQQLIMPIPEPTRTVESIALSEANKDYVYTVLPHDTYWRIIKEAISDYTSDHHIVLTEREKNAYVPQVLSYLEAVPLHGGDSVTIPEEVLHTVIKKEPRQ